MKVDHEDFMKTKGGQSNKMSLADELLKTIDLP
jgi:hypothetical protein